MLERLSLREDELHRFERDWIVRVIGVFGNEAGELTSLDEFFEKRPAKLFDLAFGLDFELCQVFTARFAPDTDTGIAMRRLDENRKA